MKSNRIRKWARPALLACGLLAVAITGCQTDVGGQTLPSAYYLRDDVQYFPAGPEFKLTNEARAHEEYRLQQQAQNEGLSEEAP